MDLFISLFLRIIPLYALIGLDYFAGKKLNAKKETIAPILISIVPLAANTVAFATDLKAQPEKASLAIFLSTLFGLFYIPLIGKFLLD